MVVSIIREKFVVDAGDDVDADGVVDMWSVA